MALYLEQREKSKKTTKAFLYRWTHISSGKWYVGSRTAVGCHPDDGYICSSKIVKSLITENKNEWHREVLVFGEPLYIRKLEAQYLSSVDAKNDTMSFNFHNGDGKFTTAGRIEPENEKKKRIAKLTGKKKPEGFGLLISKARTGMKFDDEWRKNIGIASTGRIQDDSARAKNSKANGGENNPSFTGYCVSPDGVYFDSCIKASKSIGVSRQTIMRWAKNNKNGWSFIVRKASNV